MPDNLKHALIHMHVTGTRPDLNNLRPSDIHFEDIKHVLCRLPRFNCNTSRHYTVGEHSILVMQMLEHKKLDALLLMQGFCHDFTEAYSGDIPAPVKAAVPSFREFEDTKLWPPIAKKFGLPPVLDPIVKHYDWVALFVEAISLCPSANLEDWEGYATYGEEAREWIEEFGAIEGREAPPLRLIEQLFTGCFAELWTVLNRNQG